MVGKRLESGQSSLGVLLNLGEDFAAVATCCVVLWGCCFFFFLLVTTGLELVDFVLTSFWAHGESGLEHRFLSSSSCREVKPKQGPEITLASCSRSRFTFSHEEGEALSLLLERGEVHVDVRGTEEGEGHLALTSSGLIGAAAVP